MPTPITEYFNGGLVTARHPALLKTGELQKADECVYRENDPAIHRAPARSEYNSTAFGSLIKGVSHLTFDGGTPDALIAYSGSTLWNSDFTALTGSFTEMGTSGIVPGTTSGASKDTFTATTGFPFLASIVGARVIGLDSASASIPNTSYVLSVSNQSGTTGHYSTITLTVGMLNNGACSPLFEFGTVGAIDSTLGTDTEILSIVNVGQQYFTWNGATLPRRIAYRDRATINGTAQPSILTYRPMGLNPVTTAFSATLNAADSVGWNSTLGAGYYWFIVNEIYAPGGDVTVASSDPNLSSQIIESAYTAPDPNATDPANSKGRPLTHYVGTSPVAIATASIATSSVTITFPTNIANNGTDGRISTNWGIYMAGPTVDTRTPPSLALFRRVAAPSIRTASYKLSDANITQWKNAATTAAADSRPTFTNAANMTGGADSIFAYSYSGSVNLGVQKEAATKLTTWNFSSGGAYSGLAVSGVEVQVKAISGIGDAGFYVRVGNNTKTTETFLTRVREPQPGVIYVGGANNTLNVSWAATDFTDANGFYVVVGKTGTGSSQLLGIDTVSVKVYYSGITLNLNGPAYKVVTYSSQIGVTVNDPANLPPPINTTGTMFNGSYLVNDTTDRTIWRYSLANYPESFPAPYKIAPNSKRRDITTFTDVVGQVAILGYRDSIKRCNYLPKETDTDFQNGLCYDDITTDHGIAGALAAAKFDLPGQGILLFYASLAGVFMTDGIATRPANADLDWANTVNLAYLSSCIVKVNAKNKWIELYYCPSDASHGKNTKKLIFHYSQDKIKDGMLPTTGPISVSARAACEANLSGILLTLTANEALKKIYVEDQGTVMPTSYTVANSSNAETAVVNSPWIRTRKMYPAGISGLAREERILPLHAKNGSSFTVSSTTTTGSTDVTSSAAFGNIVKGMRVRGTGTMPGCIVTKDKNDATYSTSKIQISRAAIGTGINTLTFDDGTISITPRGSNIDEDVVAMDTTYCSTLTGDLSVVHNDNAKQGLEIDIQKVLMPDGTIVDLGVAFRLHNLTILLDDLGTEQNRAS